MNDLEALKIKKEIIEGKVKIYLKETSFKLAIIEIAIEKIEEKTNSDQAQWKKNYLMRSALRNKSERPNKHKPETKQDGYPVTNDDIFDAWWYENRENLLAIYAHNIDPNMAVLNIAQAVWEGSKK